MKILISGATGLVGSAVCPSLTAAGHSVTRLVRKNPQTGDVLWNPETGAPAASVLEGFDAVIHLAGENLVAGYWTEARKRRIVESRTKSTRLLSQTFAKLKKPPKTFIVASAIGYYGDRGEELLTEDSGIGSGFLADTCRLWEASAEAARAAGIRVVHTRFGIILSPKGGALAKMLPPFRFGMGGPLSTGHQWMSWVAIDDVIGVLHHVLRETSLVGPVNVVAPEAIRNEEFSRTLAEVLHRPSWLRVPAVALYALFGREMTEEALLASSRVQPKKLSGYAFELPTLREALKKLTAKGGRRREDPESDR